MNLAYKILNAHLKEGELVPSLEVITMFFRT